LSPDIENGSILDMHMVAGEITDILVTERISNRETIICINSGMILYREIEIPKPKAGTETLVVETIIQNEMQLGNEYNITYSISGEVATEEGSKLKVVAAACPQKIIDIYLELARQVGLKARLVMVSNTCITRLVRIRTSRLCFCCRLTRILSASTSITTAPLSFRAILKSTPQTMKTAPTT
jgi:type IV pilus assembly protein PilM